MIPTRRGASPVYNPFPDAILNRTRIGLRGMIMCIRFQRIFWKILEISNGDVKNIFQSIVSLKCKC